MPFEIKEIVLQAQLTDQGQDTDQVQDPSSATLLSALSRDEMRLEMRRMIKEELDRRARR